MDKLCDPVSTIQNKLNVPRRENYTLSASKQNGVQNLFMANRNFK